ncbi:MAG: glycogen debranching N-terminal domain-containing protein [Gaiellaceae bacterium]
MPEDLIILDGCTFMYSNEAGDVETRDPEGFFYEDVRHLSTWQLQVDGKPVEPLSSRRVDYYSARIVGGDESLAVRRDRFVSEGMHEDVVVENLGPKPREVRVEVQYGSDFADVMEAQEGGNGEGRSWTEAKARSVTLWHRREGYTRGTALTFSRAGRVDGKRARFRVHLGPGQAWSLCIDVSPIVNGERRPCMLRCGAFHDHAPKMPVSLDEWLEETPELQTEHDTLEQIYRQSNLDLAALRVRPDNVTIKFAMPGGGLPWFMTIFGRDSLITAYEALPFHPELAQAALEALAEMQADDWDNWRDAEPGKILHELRRGSLAALDEIPHTPYYGSHDSTLWWLIVLDEYQRWSGDDAFVRRMEPHARAALDWLEGPADLDGDGYLEYRKRSSSDVALDNHCWKDSSDSIRFADGRLAKPPIATCELQGYAYDARLRTARLMREIWQDEETAERLERDAAELKRRFNRDFWVRGRGHFALALDKDKNQVDSLTSNIGHLLFSGIVDERRARSTVRALVRDDMFSGWGIRSMSSKDGGYNPLSYHCGSIWPHDTAICAAGMRRYGFDLETARVSEALLAATEAFSNQLPEVFAGFARDKAGVPVEYPDALKPQSWAAAAPLLLIRTLLGLETSNGKVRTSPSLPPSIERLGLRGATRR